MIRFCDKEVYCITEGELDRQQLMHWFFNGHRKELVCLLSEAGTFIGMITYDSLLGRDMEDAIKKDYLLLDEEIWERGRRYFREAQRNFTGSLALLPILNREHELMCFAWQDDEANRELRMLDELSQGEEFAGFQEVYPKYDSVTIHGCNELAYYFACYLKQRNVPVCTVGALWEVLDPGRKLFDGDEGLDYRNYNVYAEGINGQEENEEWRESVSVQFECINRIYEENILRGLITDAKGSLADMVEQWKEKKLYILGTGTYAWNAYDLLLGHGLDIEGYVSGNAQLQGKTVFGKKVYSLRELPKKPEDILLLETTAQYSAWGFGGVDHYHYLGYKRNETFCLLADYIEIPKNGLFNLLHHRMKQSEGRIALMGDYRLCLKLGQILEQKNEDFCGRIVYCDLLQEYGELDRMVCITGQKVLDEDACLLLLPDYYGCEEDKEVEKRKYQKELERFQIMNYVDYSLEPSIFRMAGERYTAEDHILCDKILLGASDYFSGNTLLNDILRGHPDTISLPYAYLRDNLYSICVRLSMEKREDILPLFWEMYDEPGEQKRKIRDRDAFSRIMGEMLSGKEYFTSQELFVMIHVSFAGMRGEVIKDISKITIFWEPHEVSRDVIEEYAYWLKTASSSGYIIKVVRNAYMRAGSCLRFRDSSERRHKMIEKGGNALLKLVVKIPESREKEYEGWERVTIKFEDLKCNPQEEMHRFCEQTKIPWSDKLLEAYPVPGSLYGTVGWDLLPVYRTYEEYFSTFDKFRMTLMAASWQRKYGYPYISCLEFSRRELWEFFMKKYKFEDFLTFENENEKQAYMREKISYLRYILWKNRREEVMWNCMNKSDI